jgi:RimJ/RimL family protein N-acetyltransferase
MTSASVSDVLLVRTRLATGAADGREADMAGLRLVASADGWLVFPGSRVSQDLADRLRRVVDVAAPENASDAHADLVGECANLLEREIGPTQIEAARIFRIGQALHAEPAEDIEIVSSARAGSRVASFDRPLSWEQDEWTDLLGGRHGPWAIAAVGDTVASICHTPRPFTPDAAECGVWTHPDWRGRRLAEATTAAWADLARAPGRSIFYSADMRNEASQRVAQRLGLALIGTEYRLDASPMAIGDAWGRALLDHYRGVWVPTPELETDTGKVTNAMHPEWFFRGFDVWDWWDRELLPLAAQGPAVDLGAGAGRAALWLQDRGIAVSAVDSSPGAVEVCRLRGVRNVRVGDLCDPPTDQPWRLILLLCGNLGLAGSWDRTRSLLNRLAEIWAPDAAIVADTVDPRGPAEVGLRIRYRRVATPWWRQINVPVRQLAALIDGTGWRIDRHLVDEPDHAVLLRRA